VEYRAVSTAVRECVSDIEHTISRAFLTAHLLTASTEQAESATMEAIDSWDPDEETEEVLFRSVLDAAARAQIEYVPSSSNKCDVAGSYLPAELQAVLRLAPQLRRCFVLRILVGLSPQVCARLLHLPSRRVDRYACAALECLGSLDRRLTLSLQYAV
jgi:DNA-directed RNA polymerase specialized sigma24 family protein